MSAEYVPNGDEIKEAEGYLEGEEGKAYRESTNEREATLQEGIRRGRTESQGETVVTKEGLTIPKALQEYSDIAYKFSAGRHSQDANLTEIEMFANAIAKQMPEFQAVVDRVHKDAAERKSHNFDLAVNLAKAIDGLARKYKLHTAYTQY